IGESVSLHVWQVGIRILNSSFTIGVEPHRADLAAKFHTVPAFYPTQIVDVRQGPRRIRRSATVCLTVQTDQTSSRRDARSCTLTRNSIIGCTAREINADSGSVETIEDGRHSVPSRVGCVIAELHFVDH